VGDLRRAFASSLDATQCDRESLRSAGLRLISQRCPAPVALGGRREGDHARPSPRADALRRCPAVANDKMVAIV
jgi:hypothetical protein